MRLKQPARFLPHRLYDGPVSLGRTVRHEAPTGSRSTVARIDTPGMLLRADRGRAGVGWVTAVLRKYSNCALLSRLLADDSSVRLRCSNRIFVMTAPAHCSMRSSCQSRLALADVGHHRARGANYCGPQLPAGPQVPDEAPHVLPVDLVPGSNNGTGPASTAIRTPAKALA
jgi:hypothetical protein